MKIIKALYQKAFVVGPYLQEKIGLEIEIDGTCETPELALDQAKKIVEQWHKANNQITPQLPGPPTEIPVINKAEERLGILIENASTIAELKQYKDKLSTPHLADIFWSKHHQLATHLKNE
jgi:hypothetical protein